MATLPKTRRRRTRKPKRDLTEEESWEIIQSIASKDIDIMNLKNHRKVKILRNNTFRFTVDIISLDLLISLMEHKHVKNVYSNPSHPPPGGSTDSISLRYKVYVEYDQI